MNEKEIKKYIPLDKSWIIRMGVLDIINGYDDINKFLDNQKGLSDDLLALKRASESWSPLHNASANQRTSNESIDVGESGTLYRLLQFASWKLNLNKKFILRGTLKKRNIVNDASIINLSLGELLKLDGGTSQWATAAVLLGNKEKMVNLPYKLNLTYEAVQYWKGQRAKRLSWKSKYDETILRQAKTYLALLQRRKEAFKPEQAEDYCFARIFNFITRAEGEKKWPNLRNHESNRIVEMEKMIEKSKLAKIVNSRDHRVVQAVIMWSKVNMIPVKVSHPKAVNKSWPEFWNFINAT
ncbi:MAG: hypothetical protein Q8L47_05250 [bacterium]|nr:hypothetical protein [bacterium]